VVVEQLQVYSAHVRSQMPVDVSDVNEDWDESGNLRFSFKAMGLAFSGTIVTCEERVTVDGKLPIAALPFRGVIENQVEERILVALGRRS
jgi:hypothetical protein